MKESFRRIRLQRELQCVPILTDLDISEQLRDRALSYNILINSGSYLNLYNEMLNTIKLLDTNIEIKILININRDRSEKPSENLFQDLIFWMQNFKDLELLSDKLGKGIEANQLKLMFVDLDKVQHAIKFKNFSFLEDHEANILLFSNDLENDSVDSFEDTKLISRISVSWPWGDPLKTVNHTVKIYKQLVEESDIDFGVINQDFDKNFIESLRHKIELQKKLRPHQVEAINMWFENDCKGIYAMCTGAGKTIAALETIKQLKKQLDETDTPLRTVIIICPLQVLVEQWEDEVIDYGLPQPTKVYSNKKSYIGDLKFIVNGSRHLGFEIIITTPASFLHKPAAKKAVEEAIKSNSHALLVVDEMHNMASINCRKSLRKLSPFFKYRLGLSATPEIEGDDQATLELDEYFGGVVGRYELADGIRDGYLCKYKYYPKPVFLSKELNNQYLSLLSKIDLASPKDRLAFEEEKVSFLKQANQYIPGLEEIISDLEKNNKTVEKTLVFCPPGKADSDDSQRLIQEAYKVFKRRDLQCQLIISQIDKHERAKVLEAFRKNETKVLLSITCLDEGMNVPATNRAIILYSLNREKQFIQRRGRVLRNSPGKEFAIIHDIIILPQNAELPENKIQNILDKETRRYLEFATLAINKDEALGIINDAIYKALNRRDINV